MKFNPKYTITNKLLENIKEVNRFVFELNNKHFPNIVQAKFEKEADILSSYASTSIEGNPLPLTEVKKLLKSTPINIRDSEREVLNYNKELEVLNKQIDAGNILFGNELILSIHKQVTEGLLQEYQIGKYRKEPVFVNNPKTRQTIYLPPDSKDVIGLISELIGFINEQNVVVDALILAGIFHKQFVVIHPFIDGNGRTCRLATKVLLANLGLNTFNLFSFENYYNENLSKYFQYVGERGSYYDIIEEIDFTAWLEFFTEGIINEIQRVKKELDKVTSTPEYSILKDQDKMIKYIRNNGYITDGEYANITIRAKATRVIDFNKLRKLGIIERKGVGRKTYYVIKE
ncbi:Fic family protein [Candidatus Dojkabacteria bacterium]|jgi:Fic family protein|nr:Fic family protein [Candidatus Dojkabacteria bacterium]